MDPKPFKIQLSYVFFYMKEFYQKGNSSNAQRMVSDEESKMPGKGKRPRRCDHRKGRPEMFSTEIPRSLCIASRVGDIGTADLAHCQSSFVNICCLDGRRSQR